VSATQPRNLVKYVVCCSLYNDAVRKSDDVMPHDLMILNNELRRM